MIDKVKTIGSVKVLSCRVDVEKTDELKEIASGIVVLGSVSNGKATILAAITKDLTNRFNAG